MFGKGDDVQIFWKNSKGWKSYS